MRLTIEPITCGTAVDRRGHPTQEGNMSILACRRRVGGLVVPGVAWVQRLGGAGPLVGALVRMVGVGWDPGGVATGEVLFEVV